ncbi:MAG: bifunctional ADP-heptose synthase [Planctomycetota bacterium]
MALSARRTSELMEGFAKARIAVVGDFMADVYLNARPARLSREAPVMVVRYQGERMIPGGAANAVNNLVALGAQVQPIGVLGADPAGQMLKSFFEEHTLGLEGVVPQADYDTVAKTRVMVGAENRSRQQVLRIDREPERLMSKTSRDALLERVEALLPSVDALVLSDYGYGTLDKSTSRTVIDLAGDKLTTGDSRYELSKMRGVTVAKPNHDEAEALVGFPVRSDADAIRAGEELLKSLESQALLLTRGNKGMMLSQQGCDSILIAAADSPGEVTDVSGAGDTVVGIFTLALIAGANFAEAAELANYGAGVVVGKLGAATVSPAELLKAATINYS